MTLPFSYLKLFLVVTCLTLTGCEVINPEEDIPAYISISDFSFTTDTTTEGSNAHKITDAWVYVDDQLIGAFELPVKAPVLYSGAHQVKVLAGIKANGIAATRIAYPFYLEHAENVNLKPGEVTTIKPAYEYADFATFLWLENFEKDTFSLKRGEGSDTTLNITNENAFEGKGCGKFELNESRTDFAYLSKQTFKLTATTSKIYLEINYKSTGQIQVGINAHYDTYSQVQTSLIINPSSDSNGNSIWNKIYVDITPAALAEIYANNFSIYIAAVKPATKSSQVTYIDNIKLVTR